MKSKNVPTLTEGLLHNFFLGGGRGIPHTHADRFKKTSTSMHGKPKIPCGSWHRCGYNALLGLPQFAFLQKLTLFILEKKFEISSVRKSPLVAGNLASSQTEKKGGYSETVRRAPKRGREEQQRNGFQVVHIAPAKRRLIQRLAGLPRGEG